MYQFLECIYSKVDLIILQMCIYYRVPLTPVSNQNRTSLSTVNTISSGQVMRIKKCQLQDY